MKKSKNWRIIVDANGWISSLLSLDFRIRIGVVFDAEYRVITSERLFGELENAIRKPHLEKRIDRTNYEQLISLLRRNTEIVDVHSTVDVCRDPKDNYLLALAKDGNADYLITGDGDLRVLKVFGKTKIVSIKDFEVIARQ